MGCHASRQQEHDDLAGLAGAISSGLEEERAEATIPANAEAEPAAALPSAADLGVDERKLDLWRELGGGDLEPVLTSGAVALLDAEWIIRHAEAGGDPADERHFDVLIVRDTDTAKLGINLHERRGEVTVRAIVTGGAAEGKLVVGDIIKSIEGCPCSTLEEFRNLMQTAPKDTRMLVCRRPGGVLNHRQALPEEAFLSLADLVEAINSNPWGDWLPVGALSYPWLTKDHPDPRGANLSRVARALKKLTAGGIPLGVFWDFGSLHQHPDPPNGVMRTEEQNALFKQGLGCLGTLYSHPHTIVLRLTSFPDGHEAEGQAEGTNVAKYFDRGWCFTEQSWASLTKAGDLSLDLGKMRAGKEYDYLSLIGDCARRGGRRPPLLPSAFAAELETKSFTNGKDDKPLVKRLYAAAFEEQFGKATELNYYDLGWGDAEAAQLAEVLASGAAPRLEELNLASNEIGNEGCKALAAALKEGAAPSLKMLDVGWENREQPELVAVCEERGIALC